MGWLHEGTLYARNFLFAEQLPVGQHTLTLKVLPKDAQATGNLIRIGGFCVTNPPAGS
jgi:hypothetical protein